jgi:3-oxoacyl-[acyl-carrier-protein] synthase II
MTADGSAEATAVLVTGIGLLTPLADSLDGVASAWQAGRTGVAESADARPPASRLGAIDTRRYANVRGMRAYARNTQLQICAAQRALDDAGVDVAALDPTRLGVVSASSVSHVETLIEYDGSLVTAGVQGTNPTLMPLALPSAPGALTALSFGAKAFAITLCDGGASGLAALGLGARLLRERRADLCLVVSAFTECDELS